MLPELTDKAKYQNAKEERAAKMRRVDGQKLGAQESFSTQGETIVSTKEDLRDNDIHQEKLFQYKVNNIESLHH